MNAADLMRITQDKIVQYAGAKFGTAIATKLQTKTTIIIPPPQYSNKIITRHVAWEKIQHDKQRIVHRVLEAKKVDLEARVLDAEDVEMDLVKVKSTIDEKNYKLSQPVEYRLSKSEKLEHYNDTKTYSMKVAALEKHHGQLYSVIYGQCTTILQDKIKNESEWDKVNTAQDPLLLYKLIEKVILKQTKDQYPFAVMWDQYVNVFGAKQPSNVTYNQWHELFKTKIEVGMSVGCTFAQDKALDYCALEKYKLKYKDLQADEMEIIDKDTMERFIGYGIIQTSDANKNGKV